MCNKNRVVFTICCRLITLAAGLIISVSAWGQSASPATQSYQNFHVPIYQSDIITLEKTPARVSVANPDIADILVLPNKQVHVLGKSLGTTNVVFWDRQESIFHTASVAVTHDLLDLKRKLHVMMPDEPIHVFSAQEKLILKGQVSSAGNASAAIKVAEGYIPDCGASATTEVSAGAGDGCGNAEVVNLMTVVGSQQIMLEVTVAEISRTFLRSLDTDLSLLDFSPERRFGAVNGGASWPNVLVRNEEIPYTPAGVADGEQPVIGPIVDKYDPTTPTISDKGLFLQDLTGDNFFQAALELSRSKGLAKVLAEPTLTTLTGRPAEFLSGGEFPVPIPGDGTTSIQFKDFGVKVKFLPTILERGRISLDLDIGVTELTQNQPIDVSSAGSSGVYIIPSLSKRGVTSTVELANGQTIGIAGLIQDNVREVMTRLPGIGDIPIIGSLFRSQEFVSGQTELVIFVTANLAQPISEDQIRLPTDSFVPPDDIEFYLLGRMEGRGAKSGSGDERAESVLDKQRVGTQASTELDAANSVHSSRLASQLSGGFDGVSFGHDL